MSKLFFDNIADLKKLDKEIKKVAKTKAEQEEIWRIVDELIHHKALGCIFENLPKDKHTEFLELFHHSPHDEDLLFGYLEKTISQNFREILREEIGGLAFEVIEETKKTPRN